MVPKSKLDMLDYSTLGFRVFLKDVPPRSPSILLIFVPLVMPVCMASYMTADYGHANHAFKVNVRS